ELGKTKRGLQRVLPVVVSKVGCRKISILTTEEGLHIFEHAVNPYMARACVYGRIRADHECPYLRGIFCIQPRKHWGRGSGGRGLAPRRIDSYTGCRTPQHLDSPSFKC